MSLKQLIIPGIFLISLSKLIKWIRHYKLLKALRTPITIETLKKLAKASTAPVIAAVGGMIKASDASEIFKASTDKTTKVLFSTLETFVLHETTQLRAIKQLTTATFKYIPLSLVDSTGSIPLTIPSSVYQYMPLQTIYSNFIEHESLHSPNLYTFLHSIYRGRLMGFATEEKVLLPYNDIKTAMVEAIYDRVTDSFVFKLLDQPFQFSKSLLYKEITTARIRLCIYSLLSFSIASYFINLGYREFKKYMKERKELVMDKPICCICLEDNSSIVLLPCGHICSCEDCSEKFDTCPVCRSNVELKKKLIFA